MTRYQYIEPDDTRLEQDRFKNYIDTGSVSLQKSSQIRARSSASHPIVTPDDVAQYTFDNDHYSRRDDYMLAEEERRRGGQPSTYEDRYIDPMRARPLVPGGYRVRVPRLTPSDDEPERKPRQLSSRRKLLLGAAGVAAVAIGGQTMRYNADQANAAKRMQLGKFSFHPQDIVCGHHDSIANPTWLYTWIQSDHIVRFLQVNGNGETKLTSIPASAGDYSGPLDQVVLSFEIHLDSHPKMIILNMDVPGDNWAWQFNDNGELFV